MGCKSLINIFVSFVVAFVLIVGGVIGFFAYKKNSVEGIVHSYLIENGKKENEIEYLEPFIANLSGDKNYMVGVKFKNEDKVYNYYYDRGKNKVVLLD